MFAPTNIGKALKNETVLLRSQPKRAQARGLDATSSAVVAVAAARGGLAPGERQRPHPYTGQKRELFTHVCCSPLHMMMCECHKQRIFKRACELARDSHSHSHSHSRRASKPLPQAPIKVYPGEKS